MTFLPPNPMKMLCCFLSAFTTGLIILPAIGVALAQGPTLPLTNEPFTATWEPTMSWGAYRVTTGEQFIGDQTHIVVEYKMDDPEPFGFGVHGEWLPGDWPVFQWTITPTSSAPAIAYLPLAGVDIVRVYDILISNQTFNHSGGNPSFSVNILSVSLGYGDSQPPVEPPPDPPIPPGPLPDPVPSVGVYEDRINGALHHFGFYIPCGELRLREFDVEGVDPTVITRELDFGLCL